MILQNIRNLSSLNNFKKGSVSSQVATLLILIIAAMLIFVLVVANIGQVSNYATNLSNAADAASLYLASQVATKSFMISKALLDTDDCVDRSPTRCCRRKGLLSVVLATIVAVIAVVLTIYTGVGGAIFGSTMQGVTTASIIAGAVGGAVGGGIGGAIAGTGWAQGAIHGAMIGASIGAGASLGLSIGPGVSAALQGISPFMMGASSTAAAAALGASLGITLSAASSIYSAYAKDAMLADAMAAAVKALSGLPEKQRRREGVFLQALSSTVDDPNRIPDNIDSDSDGDIQELVPAFQVCWDKRITRLKEGNMPDVSEAARAINRFFDGPVARFKNAIDKFLNFLPAAATCVAYDDYGNCIRWENDSLIAFLIALEQAGYDVSFWMPGPRPEELENWKGWDPSDCIDCEPPEPPQGYDEVDYTIDFLNDFKTEVNELKEYGAENLAYSWQIWVPWFYEPPTDYGEESPGGMTDNYYHSLYALDYGDRSSIPYLLGLEGWRQEIERIRLRLPRCIYGYHLRDDYGNIFGECIECDISGTRFCGECIVQEGNNPPCQWHPNDSNFGTIDTDLVDEFKSVQKAIADFSAAKESFREACRNFYYEIKGIMEPLEQAIAIECGENSSITGINPAVYSWRDSRCPQNTGKCHSVWVSVGNYHEPRLVKRKYGNWLKGKVCIELVHHTQDVRVNIERRDPSNIRIGAGSIGGLLGRWNPLGGTIRRSSVARFRGVAGGSGYVRIQARE